MHEIHAYHISFYSKFSQLSHGIKINILSFILFGSETNDYVEVKTFVFANFVSFVLSATPQTGGNGQGI